MAWAKTKDAGRAARWQRRRALNKRLSRELSASAHAHMAPYRGKHQAQPWTTIQRAANVSAKTLVVIAPHIV